MLNAELSELRNFRKVKVSHFHCRHNHVERLLPTGAHREAHRLNIRQHRDETLIEAKISQTTLNLAVLDEESPITGHAGHDLFVGIDLPDVPQARDQYAALG